MAEHTPGPWEARERFYIHAAGHTGSIAEVKCCLTLGPESPQHEANARLIAAAPDMLAALDDVLADRMIGLLSEETRQSVRHAIEKAEGRTP